MVNKKANKKIAVVLFNLGGPDSLGGVRRFLFNLFYDPAIITIPNPFRWFLAHFISFRRYKSSQKLYALMGGKSPIMEETQAQADNLQRFLNSNDENEYKVFISMRYFEPFSDSVIKEIEVFEADEITLLPLYPQFSTTTTGSSINDFQDKLSKSKISDIAVKTVCCYNKDKKFIKSHVNLIKKYLPKDISNLRILFSAHGLPQKTIDMGDPYQFQVENSVKEIIEILQTEYKQLDYKICYQSKVGPLKWLEPNAEDEIKLAGKQNRDVMIIPIAFVSEHVETLVELDIEYKEIAVSNNIDYIRVPTLSIDSLFIESLADQVRGALDFNKGQVAPIDLGNKCDNKFVKCPCKT